MMMLTSLRPHRFMDSLVKTPWSTAEYRCCPTCGGSGKLWWTETKYWQEGESEPPSHPALISCFKCHGVGALRNPD